MVSALAIVAVFVASVSAITITSPNPSKGWTNDGAQTVSWTSDSSDPQNFTIILTNTNNTDTQVLDALVPSDQKTISVNPPATGWPAVGSGYRVAFAQDTEHLSSVLIKSDLFSIKAAPSVSSSSPVAPQTPTTPAVPTTPADGGSGSATDSGSSPAGTNAALPAMGLHIGSVATLALLSAVLAQF
ncbi:hypothetical protein B0H19DRAFT_1179541 [Mycena capillaripes]|nr:hypothetical protein B0H19DRAFT_1179541 [Mycena capillaripes]